VTRGKIRLEQAVTWEGAAALTPATADALGQQLRQRLRAAGIGSAPLLVCLAREQVILKEIRYPRTDADQEPTLVRFQATKELTESPESVVIDYVRLERPGPAGEQLAHVLIARRDLVNAFKALAKAAGLRLAALTPRAFGLAACLRQAEAAAAPEQGAAAVLAVADGMAEFCIAQGEMLLAARPLPQAEAGLVEDLRRNLSLYASQPGGLPVKAVYVAGADDKAALRNRLQESLTMPVRALDPLAGMPAAAPTDRAGFGGPVGLLYLWAEKQTAPANFIAPKEPKAPTDTGRRRLLRVAGLAFLGLLLAILLTNVLLAGKRAEVEELQKTRNDLDTRLTAMEPVKRRLTDLKEWYQSDIHVIDELYDLAARFPFHKGVRVTHVDYAALGTAKPGKDAARGKGKASAFTGRITIMGVVPRDETALLLNLVDDINQDSHLRADAPQIRDATSGEKSQGLQEFVFHIDIQPEAKYTTILVPPAADGLDWRDLFPDESPGGRPGKANGNGFKQGDKRPKEGFKGGPKFIPKEGFKGGPKFIPKEGFKGGPKFIPKEGFKDKSKAALDGVLPRGRPSWLESRPLRLAAGLPSSRERRI